MDGAYPLEKEIHHTHVYIFKQVLWWYAGVLKPAAALVAMHARNCTHLTNSNSRNYDKIIVYWIISNIIANFANIHVEHI